MCPPLGIYYFSSNFLTILQYACTFLQIFAAKSTLFLFFCTYTFLTFWALLSYRCIRCKKHHQRRGVFRRILCILLPVICRIDKTEPAWIAPCRFRFSCMLLRNCMLDLSEAYSMFCGGCLWVSSCRIQPESYASAAPRALQAAMPSSFGASLQITLSAASTAPKSAHWSSQECIHSPVPQP